MAGKVKFVHWLESPFEDIPSEPMFNVISNDRSLPNGSTVGLESLKMTYGVEAPKFPSLAVWKEETENKRRCFRCWAVIRGNRDGIRHRKLIHREAL